MSAIPEVWSTKVPLGKRSYGKTKPKLKKKKKTK
jgi:hypothetical protein